MYQLPEIVPESFLKKAVAYSASALAAYVLVATREYNNRAVTP